MLATLEQLSALENEKRQIKPDSPRFQDLALEVERLAADLFAQTHNQERLARESPKEAAARGKELPPINEVESNRDLAVILAEWRDAERTLAEVAPRTAEHSRAAAEINRLRAEYQRVYAAQKKPQKG
jgi:hypothetical protein